MSDSDEHGLSEDDFKGLRQELDRVRQDLAAKSEELRESTEHQSAMTDVLAIMGKSPGDVQPVLDTIAVTACSLCKADHASIFKIHDDACHLETSQADPEFVQYLRDNPLPLHGDYITTRAARELRVMHIANVNSNAEFDLSYAVRSKSGTLLSVPLARDEVAIGVMTIGRYEAMPFTERQVNLVRAFADQGAIAIENARLFEQVEAKTNELAALNSSLEERVRSQVDELDRLGRLRRFLPRQLAEMVINSGDESLLDSHRREVSVVICDLRGFTAFSEIAEPEEVMVVLNEYHRVAGPLIEQHGGTIERFLGDGLMVLFNDPIPCDKPAHQAARMSVALRDTMSKACAKWEGQGYELGFGVGIAHGFATLGKIGFEGRMEYTAIGTVVNQAARLCGEAAAGEILITHRVANMTKDLIQAEPLGELALKGFRQPIQGYRLLELSN